MFANKGKILRFSVVKKLNNNKMMYYIISKFVYNSTDFYIFVIFYLYQQKVDRCR